MRANCPVGFTALASIGLAIFGISVAMAGESASASEQEEPLWVVYEGGEGPGKGKHIVLISGDDEYRSEEALPMLGKILAVRHGFKCTVLFPIDPADGTIKPDHQTNIPGLEALADADVMVMGLRFRELPDEQMKYIVDFMNEGKPIVGVRTSTHAFNYRNNNDSPYAKYSFNSRNPRGGFGQAVLGDTWISHHGHHGRESTRGVINPDRADHIVLRGVEDVWGPTDVYGIRNLPDDADVLMYGQVIAGMDPEDDPVEGDKNDPMMPLAWFKDFEGDTGNPGVAFCTTMGSSTDFESEDLRRLMVNVCYLFAGLEDQIPESANVEYVGEYHPTAFGFGTFTKGLKPSDFLLED